MPTASNARITLELETGADPIRGSIEHPDGNRQLFWGWLELIEQLRRAAAGEHALAPQPSPANAEPPPEQAKRPPPQPTTGEQP